MPPPRTIIPQELVFERVRRRGQEAEGLARYQLHPRLDDALAASKNTQQPRDSSVNAGDVALHLSPDPNPVSNNSLRTAQCQKSRCTPPLWWALARWQSRRRTLMGTVLHTHSIIPTLPVIGITAYVPMRWPRCAVAGAEANTVFITPNSC